MGASQQLVALLNQAGLSPSYQSIHTAIDSLANRSLEAARVAAAGPHVFCYDNIQISTSIFVEQTLNICPKVQSGTFAVIYELPHAKPEDVLLGPLLERERTAQLLELHDLWPSRESAQAYLWQTSVNIIKVLVNNVDTFSGYHNEPLLQNVARRKLPNGQKTTFHCLQASDIEEHSNMGNMLMHEDVYKTQLKLKSEDFEDCAIATIGDQMTNGRFCTIQEIRKLDINPWE
ncbi:hypothetical protein EST38_g1907 [Candolleomyces aberdarensis]|uniref:DUF6589 domain-containing protein n=1 Tax=Candolleomyces aberdarensis TaxID=2316362 RepID=A0A4Q2DWB8_9AGAR|nr:hypothetical protein EST38_g1907 [Candolleomyces aberdarensis]